MKQLITNSELVKKGILLWMLLLGAAGGARAQSGPYGNEWIVAGQPYYKIKITRDGIYKLDYQYLTQTGFSGIDPARLQLWRRGREVAVYQGGTRNTFDSSTFLEFYGERNDGKLDRDLYKNAADQPHQYYSFYTDTAAYFVTYGAAAGRRMVESASTGGGTPHGWRLYTGKVVETYAYVNANTHANAHTFLPWLDKGEGFSSLNFAVAGETIDSLRAVLPTGPAPAPRLEVEHTGGSLVPHTAITRVLNVQTNAFQPVGTVNFADFNTVVVRYPVQRRDIGPDSKLRLQFASSGTGTGSSADLIAVPYMRVVVPQANRWFVRSHQLFFQNDSLLGGPATYEVDSIPATVRGYDITDPWAVQRIAPAAAQTLGPLGRRFVFPSATATQTRRLLLGGEVLLVPAPARRVRFRSISPATPTFIIVTHPQLYRSAGDPAGFNAPREYATYRASAAGGRYDTLVMTAPQLYDQFHYGERSWLALRHFGLWLANAAPANPNRYLLLLGKGLIPEEPFCTPPCNAQLTSQLTRTLGEVGLDLVPCSTRSPSDNLLTADYQNSRYVAQLHTSRITAVNSQQVIRYLNKLRTHELLNTLPPAQTPWRKNVLHLVGGYDAQETTEFRGYLDDVKAAIERPYLGGHVTTEFRVTPDKLPVSIDISTQLNAGLSMITYFGHGSNNFFALNFGSPSTALNYTNTGRYPFLFLNGCAGNLTCVRTPTVVEDWLFADQRGALGSLGESGFGYPVPLATAQTTLAKLLFNDPNWYGKPITAVHDEAVRRLQASGFITDDGDIEQLLTTGWQGDPTLALFAPPLPDLVASSASLSVVPSAGQGPVKAASTDFVLNVGVANPGKITFDPVEIQVTRVFQSGGRPNEVLTFTRRQAWGTDTTYALTIANSAVGVSGTSTFRVVLDPGNRIAESNESNNTAQLDFSFLTGGITLLNPVEFAISPTLQPRLAVQSNNPLETTRTYEFELDTVATFGSGAVRRTTVAAGVLAAWRPTLGRRDSLVWYWRARFQTAGPGEDGSWVTSSFRVIPGSPGGWSQSHYAQFRRDGRTGVEVNAPAGNWTFAPTRVPLVLRTRGSNLSIRTPNFSSLTGAGINIQSATGISSVSGCGILSPNLLVAVYNPTSLRPVAMPATFSTCGQAPDNFYYFSVADPTNGAGISDTLDNLNYSPARQQQLDAFLTAVPAGSYVALVSTNRLRYSLLPAALKGRLQALLGSQLITQLTDGEPLALLGQKLTATTGRLVHEAGPNRTLPAPGYSQGVELRDTLMRSSSAGRIVSTRIGPAQSWLNLYSTIRNVAPSNQHTLSVVAIDTVGRETVILPNVQGSAQPLTALIPATRYPYLRLELAVSDTVTRVPPQLRQWLVTSRGLPEGVVRRDSLAAALYAPATLVQQATSASTNGFVSFPVIFTNISDEAFAGPLQTRVSLRDVNQANRVVATVTISSAAPLPGRSVAIPVSLDMKGRYSTYVIEVVVNPRLQPEQNYTNNELTLEPFTIIDNNVPPTLDVAFDGRHILNGELVSPTPVIHIQLNDEDKLRHITDASFFTITLQRPNETVPTVVNVSGPGVLFSVDNTNGSVAKLEFRPDQGAALKDGIYTLRVQGRDPSNASAGAQEFEVKFEVVNATQITNVFPYPNPVISKARFVFTVTGQELPRNMKIQIMTLTGHVVREIFMSELGPLHIGNNITDFAWDGTDSYGDRLANGTYLYRVALDDPNGDFGRRATAGDRAFKNDWGKLVLMR